MSKEAPKGGRNTRTVWLIVLGALLGILFAPTSGRETRRTIVKDVKDGGRYLVSLGQDTRRELDNIAHKVSHL